MADVSPGPSVLNAHFIRPGRERYYALRKGYG
jgi:hypothetical protein